MPDSGPAISVVMAAYNGGPLIEATIASVLAQTFADFELIVVDDASADDTLDRLRAIDDPRLTVVASPVNGGPVVARNRAFALARGRYIAGLDQDDLCHPDRFAVQHAWLEAHPDAVLVASAADLLEGGTIRPPRMPLRTSPALIEWRMQYGNPLVWSSVMFRGDAARRLDVFERTDRRYAEDFDLYHRLAPFGTIARIDRALLTYRVHPGGASQRFTQMMEASAAAVLADAHRTLLGTDADASARLLQCHFGSGAPVPDVATLEHINALVARVHDAFCAGRKWRVRDRALIAEERRRLWWQMADASVRSGALTLDAVASACPEGLRARHPSPRRALGSVVIGAVRARWKPGSGR